MHGEDGFDVALVGWGTRGVEQLTVEHLRVLGQARDVAVDPGAPPALLELLRAYPAEVHDLSGHYREGRARSEAYHAMTEAVLALAERRRPVAWLAYGHPLVYSTPSRLLTRACRERGLRLAVLSGISSLDEVMSVLRLDIAERDLEVVFADHLLSRRRPLDPLVDLVVMQPGALGETGVCRDPLLRPVRDVSAYRSLQERLLRFYPPDHRLVSVCLSDERGGRHEIREVPLGGIVELAPSLHYGHTWYIRGLDPPEAASAWVGRPAGPVPPAVTRLLAEARATVGRPYGSDERSGALLRSLAASKPGGALLELGTGLGLGTAWLLDGMDAHARLTSVDVQDAELARRCLGEDARLELVRGDAGEFLGGLGRRRFDLIFADAPPGKFLGLDRALDALAPGGLYVADDLLPELHDGARRELLAGLGAALAARSDLVVAGLDWGTGLVVAARRT